MTFSFLPVLEPHHIFSITVVIGYSAGGLFLFRKQIGSFFNRVGR